MKKSILILASGDIRDKLHYIQYDCGSPALIPINTKPLASYIIDFYLNEDNCEIFLIIQNDFLDFVKNEMSSYQDKVTIISITKTKGIIDSLSLALSDNRIGNDVVVNIGTTIPTKMTDFNQILVGNAPDYSINCSFIEENNNQLHFIPKSDCHIYKKGYPFIGIFRNSKDILFEVCNEIKNKTDLIWVVEQIDKINKATIKKVDWIDCGHETNYYEAKKKLVSSRSFNNIQIDLPPV